MNCKNLGYFMSVLRQSPAAKAEMHGDTEDSEIHGNVKFYKTDKGTLVLSEIFGLPEKTGGNSVFGFHIHEGKNCGLAHDSHEQFSAALGHYNPTGAQHPYHAGDMPPLFSNSGYAFSAVLLDKFEPKDIIGKTVIIHSSPDDFTTQPSGNSGTKIACGVIDSCNRVGRKCK